MIFYDDEHKQAFDRFLNRMQSSDCFHKSAAYLLALPNVRDHANSVFDFEADAIKPDAIGAAWQTDTSRKTTRLLFNLWNGFYYDDEEQDGTAAYYVPDAIFCAGEYREFYFEAIRLRFEA